MSCEESMTPLFSTTYKDKNGVVQKIQNDDKNIVSIVQMVLSSLGVEFITTFTAFDKEVNNPLSSQGQ